MKRIIFTATLAAACFLFASAVNAGTKVNGTLNLGSSKNVTWYLPSGTPNAWVYLQHGYSRSRSNLDDLATDMMNAGLMVLTVDNGVTNGGSSDATKAANAIVDT
ncbi:MAG: hypothetical protein MUC50_17075, partial [Myxococcota bacterium]|nr:hypothetical protein [Myxococcota bacterium]